MTSSTVRRRSDFDRPCPAPGLTGGPTRASVGAPGPQGLRRVAMALAVLLLASLATACSDPVLEARNASLDQIRAALAAGETSDALQLAQSATNDHGRDGRICLAAAEACLEMKRFKNAREWADWGLDTQPVDPDLRAELDWAAGMARLGTFLELREAGAWREANSSLERATLAGSRRADAAYALARMQGLDGMGSDQRKARFARAFLQVEAQGERADEMRALLAGEQNEARSGAPR